MDVGEQATQEFTVRDEDTAEAVGSGSLPVLATPRLLAWCEAVTCVVVDRSASRDSTIVSTGTPARRASSSVMPA